jgi:hypothetical protein
MVFIIRQGFLAVIQSLTPYGDSMLRSICTAALEQLDLKKDERQRENRTGQRLWAEPQDPVIPEYMRMRRDNGVKS